MTREQETDRDVEWARRINHRWIVHRGLDACSDGWLGYLEREDPGRFRRSGSLARAMCGIRGETEDPKPWFYAGLFALATHPEATRFLPGYRLTAATVPALRDDPAVVSWLKGVGPETRELVERLRAALESSLGCE